VIRETPVLPARELAALPGALIPRVLREVLPDVSLSSRHVGALLGLCASEEGTKAVSLPGGVRAVRAYGVLRFQSAAARADSAEAVVCTEVPEEGCVELEALRLRVLCKVVRCPQKINKSFTDFLFKKEKVYGRIHVRKRMPGDALRISGRNVSKSLKKLFIEQRIPAGERDRVPVIADEAGPLAVYGMCRGGRAEPEPGDVCLHLTIERIE
jgi:tRNA(Ile)-lysidine synthase